jgi:peptidoglycan/xylan/chitin deacetylase (PgdA/CDA1 family)
MRRGFALLCVLALLAAGLLSASGCALRQETPPPVPPETEAPKATFSPSPPPTPSPTLIPYVDADWYIERNDAMREMMAQYGDYSGTKEIDQAIEKMYIDPDKPMVALTFDDGPKPGVTDAILDVLKEYNVRATFFIIGIRLNKPEEMAIVKRAIGQGCEIGNHTWTHDRLTARRLAKSGSPFVKRTRSCSTQRGTKCVLYVRRAGTSTPTVGALPKKRAWRLPFGPRAEM